MHLTIKIEGSINNHLEEDENFILPFVGYKKWFFVGRGYHWKFLQVGTRAIEFPILYVEGYCFVLQVLEAFCVLCWTLGT